MKSNSKIMLSLLSILSCSSLMAQPPTPPATPIDGGLGLLIAGGVAYGINKIRKRRL